MKATIKDYLIYGIGVILAAILYTFASFYSTVGDKPPNNPRAWLSVIGIGVLFAAVEYMIKIPAYISGHKLMDPAYIHLIWVILAFFGTNLFQLIVMKKPVETKIWIVGFLIIIELAVLKYI